MRLQEAIEYVEDHGLEMISQAESGLNAVAVGARGGGPIAEAEDFTVTGFVEQLLTKKQLATQQVLPFEEVFTQAVGKRSVRRVDLDVVESGGPFRPLTALNVPASQRGLYGGATPLTDTQKRFRSLRAGIGVTNPVGGYPKNLSVGTLGFFVTEPNGTIHLVTNNHVIGKSSDSTSAKKVIGDAVVQPGTLDLTEIELDLLPTPADLARQLQIAEVSAIVPLQFQTKTANPANRVDAATARLLPTLPGPHRDLGRLTFGGGMLGTGGFTPDPADPKKILGESRVFKVGRTTGYTEGEVTNIAGVASIEYDSGVFAYFTGQFVIRATVDNVGPFSGPGDSGSGVVNARNELIGLLFAGSRTRTLANPIADVLGELGTQLGTTLALVTV